MPSPSALWIAKQRQRLAEAERKAELFRNLAYHASAVQQAELAERTSAAIRWADRVYPGSAESEGCGSRTAFRKVLVTPSDLSHSENLFSLPQSSPDHDTGSRRQ